MVPLVLNMLRSLANKDFCTDAAGKYFAYYFVLKAYHFRASCGSCEKRESLVAQSAQRKNENHSVKMRCEERLC